MRSSPGCRVTADIIREALSNISLRPIRTVVTVLAVCVGAGTFVMAEAVNETAARQIQQKLTTAQLDQVSGVVEVDPSTIDLTATYAALIDRASDLAGVRGAAIWFVVDPQAVGSQLLFPTTPSPDDLGPPQVLAVSESWFEVQDVEVSASVLAAGGQGSGSRSVIIGRRVADRLGLSTSSAGHRLWLGRRPYIVAGFVESSGRYPQSDDSVFISVGDALTGFSGNQFAASLTVRTELGAARPTALALPHVLAPAQPGSVSMRTPPDPALLRRGVRTDLDSLLFASAALLLVFSTVAIGNLMYTNVLGRTSEIGLRRSLGASRRSIVMMVIAESLIQATIGVGLGIGVGTAGASVVARHNEWTLAVPLSAGILGALAGLGTGLVAGTLPAIRAASVDPAIALRSRV